MSWTDFAFGFAVGCLTSVAMGLLIIWRMIRPHMIARGWSAAKKK